MTDASFEPYVARVGDVLVVRRPVDDAAARGALLVFLVAPLAWVGAWASGLVFADAPLVVFVAAGLVAALPGSVGLALLATASRRAARSEVRIDPAERLLVRAGHAPSVLRETASVRVEPARGLPGGWTLSLVDRDGQRTPLLAHLPRTRGPRIAEAAERLAGELEARAEIASAARRAVGPIPRDRRLWAALCYAPIDGLFHGYALWALLASRDGATRLAAVQSLVTSALEVFLALGVVGCLGVPARLLFGAGAGVVALALPLFALGLVRTALRLYAAYRAYRGEAWVMPGLGGLARRLIPAAGARGTG